MLASATEGWSDLYVASAGASAALAGLVFVAASINVERILSYAGLPERTLVTVLLLLGVVIVSLLGLVPGQSDDALGIELLVEALLLTVAVTLLTLRARTGPEEESHLRSAAAIAAMGTLPFVVGAVLVLAGDEDGLYWTFGGMVGALIGGVVNAWVLLIEILR
ncbi:MAG TPA: hypothetical protein VFR97_13680 [Capillimicrobium sp.]|nr:hypothetical protein [Capillimicrobium sp.]